MNVSIKFSTINKNCHLITNTLVVVPIAEKIPSPPLIFPGSDSDDDIKGELVKLFILSYALQNSYTSGVILLRLTTIVSPTR